MTAESPPGKRTRPGRATGAREGRSQATTDTIADEDAWAQFLLGCAKRRRAASWRLAPGWDTDRVDGWCDR